MAAADAEAPTPVAAGALKALPGRVGEVTAGRSRGTATFVPGCGTVVALNFAENSRGALTALIFNDHFAEWPSGPAAIERAAVGKTLLVQGLVTEYRGAP
ncbi:hypothetical protein [Alienimonas sp. DA493]|uniref:hypothetical protein n=1 Tax=Alienimonas sp. DA493 TaxID=3373605 RepID=UPI003754C586